MELKDLKKYKLPDSPGVYFFKNNKEILYIGKASSLKDRVRSYFNSKIEDSRGPKIKTMLILADRVDYQATDSVLEALILEANLIKKHQPVYNTKEKDDKSFWFVVITDEEFPRLILVRGKNLDKEKIKYKFGPFPKGMEIKEALKLIRKIFPYRDNCKLNSKKACFNYQINLCPGVCIGKISKVDYQKNIKHLKYLFEGKTNKLLKTLEQEMKKQAKNREFEKANIYKKKIFSLKHLNDIALIKTNRISDGGLRIEAYDIAHLSGSNTVGVMVVLIGGELVKSEYRKFKIEGNKIDDLANLKQVLQRRFTHQDWTYPDLIVVDGGLAQRRVALSVLKDLSLSIPVVSVVKDDRHKPKAIEGYNIKDYNVEDIILVNNEAHRFAISFHRQLRRKIL